MNNTLDTEYLSHIIRYRSEVIGGTFLAFIGAVCIVSNIAGYAYRLGRDEKEREMKKYFKKYIKKHKKVP